VAVEEVLPVVEVRVEVGRRPRVRRKGRELLEEVVEAEVVVGKEVVGAEGEHART
jgi:hypothetical protein